MLRRMPRIISAMRNARVSHGLACRTSPYACYSPALHVLALIGSLEEQMQRIPRYVDRALEECSGSFIGDFLILAIFGLVHRSLGCVRTVMSATPLPA